jgi:hypothetical protein
MLTMSKQEKIVVLQVDVPESFRTKLRIEALKQGITMGELLLQVVSPVLKKLSDQVED